MHTLNYYVIGILALGDKPKPENKMPTAFTNLFKKSASSDGDKHDEKQEKPAGRKRKRNKSDKGNTDKLLSVVVVKVTRFGRAAFSYSATL